jgi:NifU-like protein involved in Fe-S cluster formation
VAEVLSELGEMFENLPSVTAFDGDDNERRIDPFGIKLLGNLDRVSVGEQFMESLMLLVVNDGDVVNAFDFTVEGNALCSASASSMVTICSSYFVSFQTVPFFF